MAPAIYFCAAVTFGSEAGKTEPEDDEIDEIDGKTDDEREAPAQPASLDFPATLEDAQPPGTL